MRECPGGCLRKQRHPSASAQACRGKNVCLRGERKSLGLGRKVGVADQAGTQLRRGLAGHAREYRLFS